MANTICFLNNFCDRASQLFLLKYLRQDREEGSTTPIEDGEVIYYD